MSAGVAFTKPSTVNWAYENCRLCKNPMSLEDSMAHELNEKVRHIFHTTCLMNYYSCPGCNAPIASINGVAVELTLEEFQRLCTIHLPTVDAEDVFNVEFDGVTFKEFLASLNKLYSASKKGDLVAVSEWLRDEHSNCRNYCVRESLVVAAVFNQAEVIKLLLGEEISLHWCQKALDYAIQNDHNEASQLLDDHIKFQKENTKALQKAAAFMVLACAVYVFSNRYMFG